MGKMFRGCGTALVTPFFADADRSVDYDAFAALVRQQVEGRVDFLVPLATTSETPSLAPDEKLELLRVARANCDGLPLMVGVGSNSFPGTLANIDFVCAGPVRPDALLVVVPFYNKPTQEGQYEYFKAVAESTDIPIIIYNVPGRTGANMLPDTVLRLAADCPGIVGIKEASGNYSQVSEIVRRAPRDFSVLSGDDDMTFAFMATGADGVISVASNALPAEVSKMTRLAARNDFVSARELHHRLSPFFKACFVESNPIPVKAAMSLLGQCGSTVRLPLSQPSESTFALMERTLTALGYLK